MNDRPERGVKEPQRFLPVLDEYTEWYAQCVRRLFFPKKQDKNKSMTPPGTFDDWLKKMQKGGNNIDSLAQLARVHEDFVSEGLQLLALVSDKKNKDVSYKKFDHFSILFEEFVHTMRRVEKALIYDDSGFDVLTGLRSESALGGDFRREQDRYSRNGKPFCLVLAEIDGIESLQKAGGAPAVDMFLQKAAGLIKNSIRSFDDAYRLKTNEFVVALKQTDVAGGIKAMERLRRALEETAYEQKLGKDVFTLSLSSCIVQPLQEDNIEELLVNLRVDVHNVRHERGSVLQFLDVSPLQRHLRTLK